MDVEYLKLNEMLAKKRVITISPSLKLQGDDISECGCTPVISQDQEYINGYTNLIDLKLSNGPFIIFGDHTEIFKWVNFPFVQGADGIKIFKVNDDKIDDKYLFYALRNCYFKTGFYQRHFKLLKKTYIPNFSFCIQHKISNLLNNYDDLIENNNKRIKLLEEMAQSLYKEWFVRFRFPVYNLIDKKDSVFGKIPYNFDVLKPNEIFDYYIGGGWGNDECSGEFTIDAYVIRGADFQLVTEGDVSTCPYRYHKPSNYEPRKLKENDIVLEISGGTVEQPVGRVVLITNGLLEQLENKVICASFCKLIRPNYNIVKPNYLYQWLKFLYDTRMIERFQLQSTGIFNFKFDYFLRKGSIMVPPTELMEKYDSYVKPIREEIDQLAKENKSLIKQRDSLLPRLMSGKLSVEGKEVI